MHIQFADLPVVNQARAKKFKDAWRWVELQFADAETTLHFIQREDETPWDSEGNRVMLGSK